MEEELTIKTFRLEPSVWELLEQHRQQLGAKSRTDALRLLIKGAKVKPARVNIDTAILQPVATARAEYDGDMVWAS
jgi:hypothetical protein